MYLRELAGENIALCEQQHNPCTLEIVQIVNNGLENVQ